MIKRVLLRVNSTRRDIKYLQIPLKYIIAENMMSQVDSEGHHYQVLTEVTDQKKDDSSMYSV